MFFVFGNFHGVEWTLIWKNIHVFPNFLQEWPLYARNGRVFPENPVVVFCIFMVYYTEEEVGKNERWSPMRSIEEISKTNPEKPLLVQVDGREYYLSLIHI